MLEIPCKLCKNRFDIPEGSEDNYRHLYFGVGCRLTPSLRPQIAATVHNCRCPDFVTDIDIVVED